MNTNTENTHTHTHAHQHKGLHLQWCDGVTMKVTMKVNVKDNIKDLQVRLHTNQKNSRSLLREA